MKHLTLSIMVCTFVLPIVCHAATQTSQLSARYEPCARQQGRDRLRCESRIRNQQEQADTTRIDRARVATETTSRMRLRLAERERRTAQNERLLRQRRTFRESVEASDVNTRRIDYLQDFRKQEYECMITAPGRTRSRCLQEARTQLRTTTRALRGLRQY